MKKIITILTLITLLTTGSIISQTTYLWIGSNNSNWGTASNWNPSRVNGQVNDILLFNNSQNITIQNVPQQTVGQIKITDNTRIMLVPASGNAKTISIQGGEGNDFVIETGSTLEIYSNDSKLGIYIKNGATAAISGNITLRGLQNHYLNAQDAQSFTFNSGSVLTQKCSGNIFTNAGTANAIVFESGSKFVMSDNSALNPFGLNTPASKVIFNNGSKYVQQCSNPASFNLNGRSYSNVEISDNIVIDENISQNVEINNLVFSGQSSLTINNSASEKSFIVNGDLNLNNSILTAYNLVITVNGNVTRTTGYVNSKLSKNISKHDVNVIFEIGSIEGYTPITLHFNNISKSGYVSVTSTAGYYRFFADSLNSIKRYWSIESNDLKCSDIEASFKYLSSDFTNTFSENEELNMEVKKIEHNNSVLQQELNVISIDTLNNVMNAGNITSTGIFTLVKTQAQLDHNINNLTETKVNTLLPKDYSIAQNYPNPFNPSTKINYSLPFNSKVSIKVFDISGKEVITLVNESKEAGNYTVTFNASNLSSGIYFYHISASAGSQSFDKTLKMILVK